MCKFVIEGDLQLFFYKIIFTPAMSHSQVWIHLKNIYMQLQHGLMNIFLMKKEYPRIGVSHYLEKSERSINESPCPDIELLAIWCRVSTNGHSKAPTWLLPSGRAWGCRWVSGLWRRGLPQGRLKAWLQSCQTWQRRPGLLPSVEAPPPLLLSRGGDPLGMEHSTVRHDGKCNRDKQEGRDNSAK